MSNQDNTETLGSYQQTAAGIRYCHHLDTIERLLPDDVARELVCALDDTVGERMSEAHDGIGWPTGTSEPGDIDLTDTTSTMAADAVPVELIAEGNELLRRALDALDEVVATIAAYNAFSDKTRATRPEQEDFRADDALGALWGRATRLWDIDSVLMVIAGTICDATGSVPGDEAAIAPSVLRTVLGIEAPGDGPDPRTAWSDRADSILTVMAVAGGRAAELLEARP